MYSCELSVHQVDILGNKDFESIILYILYLQYLHQLYTAQETTKIISSILLSAQFRSLCLRDGSPAASHRHPLIWSFYDRCTFD